MTNRTHLKYSVGQARWRTWLSRCASSSFCTSSADDTQVRADVKGEIMVLLQILGTKSEKYVRSTAVFKRAWAALTKSTAHAFATMSGTLLCSCILWTPLQRQLRDFLIGTRCLRVTFIAVGNLHEHRRDVFFDLLADCFVISE